MNQENKLPEATTLGEMNIHLAHLAESVRKIDDKLDGMDKRYVTQIEFIPIKEQVANNEKEIGGFKEWKDGLMGRLVGAGMVVGAVWAVIALLINHFWK